MSLLSAPNEAADLAGENSLTPLQREVLTELQKVLLTLQAMNEKLVATIEGVKEGCTDAAAAQERGRAAFGPVVEEMQETATFQVD